MRLHPLQGWRALAAAAFAAALFAGALPAAPQEETDKSYSKARIVRLSFVTGQVQIARPEEDDWEEALANMPIQEGYAIATGRGRAEVEFESGATVRLAENSELQFNEMRLVDGNRITRITLHQGSAIFYANLARNDEFTALTPGISVTIPRNSRFRMDVTKNNVNVTVLKGDVNVETQAGSYKVAKGKALLLDTRGDATPVVARAADADDFEQWAADRDDAIHSSRTQSLHYVSADFRYGVGDLSNHGSWVYAAPYGYVWRPWGIAAGWTPYYHGRWWFVAGYGWSWVSYEPWGWLPYHYGSWAYVNFGWVWVPGSLHRTWWHPGRVVWGHFGGGRYGWCARHPFDRPGRIHNNINVGVVVNTGTGIVRGGRHERWTGSGNDFRNWNDGPTRRDDFGDLREIRRGASGMRSNAGGRTLDNGGMNGRPDGRALDGRNLDVTPITRGQAGGDNNGAGVSSGFSGSAGNDRDPVEIRRDARPSPAPLSRENSGTASGNAGAGTSGTRNWTGNVERRRPNFGDPTTSVEYDPNRRRFENSPSTRASETEVERRGAPESLRPGTIPRDHAQERLRPQSIGETESNRGTFGGSNLPDVERRRGNDARPDSRPSPRFEPRGETRGESRGGSSGSRGGWSGRSESPRPTPAPSSTGGHGGGNRGGGSSGVGSGAAGGRPSSGGGSWGGGGGGRPSASPSPAPAPPSGGGNGNPRGAGARPRPH